MKLLQVIITKDIASYSFKTINAIEINFEKFK